nr:MAG TPA: hypothetical protein [Bacteriophage sp.]
MYRIIYSYFHISHSFNLLSIPFYDIMPNTLLRIWNKFI